MKNLPRALGHGWFYIVILYISGSTYIFLSLKGLKSLIVKVMMYKDLDNLRYLKDI